jgi:putative membrane protein
MGLANLVPGVSGGTMLLVSGVYPAFVSAVADLSWLRWRPAALALLLVIAFSAGGVVVSLAGTVKDLVLTERVAMYSLFVGLTWGGVPSVWRRARPLRGPTAGFCAAALAGMALLAWRAGEPEAGAGSVPGHFIAGVAGASAMVLPGISGGYLLLLLGEYVPILAAIDRLRANVLGPLFAGAAPPTDAIADTAATLVPFGLGVALGIVVVSHGVRAALDRFPQPTYGLLLGLLLGAGLGLWPFEGAPRVPEVGIALAGVAAGYALARTISRLDRDPQS